MKKPKTHKPFTKNDLGKRLSFYRDALESEFPILAKGTITISVQSSGCVQMRSVIKDIGKLVGIEKTSTYELVKKYKNIYDDECRDFVFIKRVTHDYNYKFITKNGIQISSSSRMDRGLNGWGVIKPIKTIKSKTKKK